MKNEIIIKHSSKKVMLMTWVFHKSGQYSNFSECLKLSWKIEKERVKMLKSKQYKFNTLYNKYYSRFYNHFQYKTNDYNVAQELCNDLFMKLTVLLTNFEPSKGKLSSYLYSIANRMVIDYYRTNNKRYNNTVSIDSFVDEAGNNFFDVGIEDQQNESNEINNDINNAISNLKNDKLQAVANLYFLDQKKYIEISEILNIPIGSVKAYVNRVKEKLQTELKHLVYA